MMNTSVRSSIYSRAAKTSSTSGVDKYLHLVSWSHGLIAKSLNLRSCVPNFFHILPRDWVIGAPDGRKYKTLDKEPLDNQWLKYGEFLGINEG